MTGTSKEVILARVSYIQYSMKFWKSKETVQTLIDLGSKVNVMTPAYIAILGLKV